MALKRFSLNTLGSDGSFRFFGTLGSWRQFQENQNPGQSGFGNLESAGKLGLRIGPTLN